MGKRKTLIGFVIAENIHIKQRGSLPAGEQEIDLHALFFKFGGHGSGTGNMAIAGGLNAVQDMHKLSPSLK
jgi:hypothetical protein